MNQVTAYRLLDAQIRSWEVCRFTDLVEKVGTSTLDRIKGDDGRFYIVESTLHWKSDEQKAIEVDLMVAVDDTGPLHRIDRTITIQAQ